MISKRYICHNRLWCTAHEWKIQINNQEHFWLTKQFYNIFSVSLKSTVDLLLEANIKYWDPFKCSVRLFSPSPEWLGFTGKVIHWNRRGYTLLLLYYWADERAISTDPISDVGDSLIAHYNLNIDLRSCRVDVQHTDTNQWWLLSSKIAVNEIYAAFLTTLSNSRWSLPDDANLTNSSLWMIHFVLQKQNSSGKLLPSTSPIDTGMKIIIISGC